MTAPPELGRQEGEIHLPQPTRMGQALWFPKLSPTNPAVVKWLAGICQTNWRPAQRSPLGIEVTSPSFWKEASAKLKEAEPEHLAETHTCACTHTHTYAHTQQFSKLG